MSYLVKAIRNLRPNAEFAFQEDDYSTIQWHVLEGKAPTQKEIDDEISKIKADELSAAQVKAESKAELLTRLGISEDEAKLLLS